MLRSPLATWFAGAAWVEIAKSALLRPLRSHATCENAGLHSGKGVIADKTPMAGGRHEG
jgi:hypothetical protein